MVFSNSATGTLRLREADSSKMYSIDGVNANITDPEDAAVQTNKLYDIAGKSFVADSQATFTVKKVVVNNG